MTHLHLHLLKGYGRLVRGVVYIAVWIALLGMLSAIITLPLWFAAEYLPTMYTLTSSILILGGVGWLLIRGQRPSLRALVWVAMTIFMVVGIALGWYLMLALTLLLASGMIAYRLS